LRVAAAQLGLPWREAWRLRPLRAALAIDAAVLAAAVLVLASGWRSPHVDAASGLATRPLRAQLPAAAAPLLAAPGRLRWSGRARLGLAAAAATRLALAVQPWRPWLGSLAGLPAFLVPGAGATAGRIGALGALLGAALLLGLEAAAALRRHGRAAAMAF